MSNKEPEPIGDLEAADMMELRQLIIKERGERAKTKAALDAICHHYVGDKSHERQTPESAIEAMKLVALAAIELGMVVARQGEKP
jgi:metal-dependent amidase/aminoacylase/carboxypeptidase family protein